MGNVSERLELLGGQRSVAGREGVLRGPLEHGDVLGRLGDLGDRLHAGRAGPDDPDALALEGDRLVRPPAGVVRRAGEVVDAGVVGLVGDEQRAGGTDQEPGRCLVTVRRFDGPALGCLVPARIGDPGVELDVLAELEPVGDVIEVGEDVCAR